MRMYIYDWCEPQLFLLVFSGDITDGMTARNLAGKAMTIRVTSDGVTVGGARVGRVDKEVLNLVVHILDDVINPAQL